MHPNLLPLLRSPETGGPLRLDVQQHAGDTILEGSLTDEAGHLYPVNAGIPRLLPRQMREGQETEIAARDAQVDEYDRMAFLNWFGKVEIPLTRRALEPKASDRLLEAGCGTGRMSRILASQVQEMVALDFSFESLRVNQRKLEAAGVQNVHLVQADLCRLPFADTAFDRIVSCQVLEHVPTHEGQQSAVAGLHRTLQPGGTLVLSAYKHSLFTRAFSQKQGMHEGGIPFFRFTKSEMREMLAQRFRVQSVTGVLVYLYLARCQRQR